MTGGRRDADDGDRPGLPPQLSVRGVGKRYWGGLWALRGITLSVGPGVLGLLGANGAGKSTLMRILATVTRPTEGTVEWNDVDVLREPDRLRNVLGYLPQDFGLYPHLNAIEFLSYLAALKGVGRRAARRRIDELLQAVGLADVRRRPLGGYSGGMRQRVGIAQALLNDPRVLIGDEPTAGLDPEERVSFRSLLSELSGDRIVILSTHIVQDVEAAATDVAILHRGTLLVHGHPEQLLRCAKGRVWELVVPSDRLADLRQRHAVSQAVRREDGVHVRVIAEEAPARDATAAVPTLEDAYLQQVAAQQVEPHP